MRKILLAGLCFMLTNAYAQSISSVNVSVGRGTVSLDFNPPADLQTLVNEGVIDSATNEINWDKALKRTGAKLSNGASNVDQSFKKIASFSSNDEFQDPKELYAKLSSSPAASKTCSASIKFEPNGNFSISSSNYGNQHNKVSGNDDDGFVALASINAQIQAGKKPYIVTSSDKTTIKQAITRAKKYWRDNADIKTDADLSQIASSIKQANIQQYLSDIGSEADPEALYNESSSYFKTLAEAEKILLKDKISEDEAKKLQGILGQEFDAHYYELAPNNKGQTLCGEPRARCCTFESDNVLSQSLCSQLTRTSGTNDAAQSSLSCTLTIGEDQNKTNKSGTQGQAQ